MEQWITDTVNALGYAGVALFMFLENVFPPIPSEVVMPSAGFAARRGELTVWGVWLAGSAGSLLGVIPWYFLGKWVGTDRLKAWADRYGKWLTIRRRDIERADSWFDRYDAAAVFFGRLIPGIRTLISLPAGFAEMPFARFIAYSAVGTALWAGFLTGVGWWVGENYHAVAKYIGWIATAVLVALVVAFSGWVIRRRHERSSQQAGA
jgi:membrane protein DedA with SNARE-associated domain